MTGWRDGLVLLPEHSLRQFFNSLSGHASLPNETDHDSATGEVDQMTDSIPCRSCIESRHIAFPALTVRGSPAARISLLRHCMN